MSDPVLIAVLTVTIPSLVFQILTFLNGRKIHALVNSQMGRTLWTGWMAARNLAIAQPTEENKRLAQVAETEFNEHQAKQISVDEKQPKP